MAFLIGHFERKSVWGNDLAVETVREVTREHLLKAKADDSYQVINLETGEYFSPEQNQWVKIKTR